MVQLDRAAHHATYYNGRSVGIEVAGWAFSPLTWTNVNGSVRPSWDALVNLVAWLKTQFTNVSLLHPATQPPDGEHYTTSTNFTCGKVLNAPGIVGHSAIQWRDCPGKWVKKDDPGEYFDWTSFIRDVQARCDSLAVGFPGGSCNSVQNGYFAAQSSSGWTASDGVIGVVEFVWKNIGAYWAQLRVGLTGGQPRIGPIKQAGGQENNGVESTTTPRSIYQALDTPTSAFAVRFDYFFQTTNGTLDVLLNGQVLMTLPAPATLPSEPTTAAVTVTTPELFSLRDAMLEFRLAGDEGAEVLLSNIMLSELQPWLVSPVWSDFNMTTNGFEATLAVGVPGNYRIEWSEDLTSWAALTTMTNVVEAVRVMDGSALGAPKRFYRAVKE